MVLLLCLVRTLGLRGGSLRARMSTHETCTDKTKEESLCCSCQFHCSNCWPIVLDSYTPTNSSLKPMSFQRVSNRQVQSQSPQSSTSVKLKPRRHLPCSSPHNRIEVQGQTNLHAKGDYDCGFCCRIHHSRSLTACSHVVSRQLFLEGLEKSKF